MSVNFRPGPSLGTPPTSPPSELRAILLGDSTIANAGGGTGDHDPPAAVPAGWTVIKNGTTYNAGDPWPATPGFVPYLIARAIAAGVTSGKIVDESAASSRTVALIDQFTAAMLEWRAQGWDDPHLLALCMGTNDLEQGDFTDGTALVEKPVKTRIAEPFLAAQFVWNAIFGAYLPPTCSEASYTGSDNWRTWTAALCDTSTNLAFVDNFGTAYQERTQHIPGGDQKHADQDSVLVAEDGYTKGYSGWADRLWDACPWG